MAGLRLAFCGDRQQDLVVLTCDVVDRNLDLFFRSPLIDQVGGGLVGAGNPVIPETHRELAGGVSAANIGRGDQRRRGGGGRSNELSSSELSP